MRAATPGAIKNLRAKRGALFAASLTLAAFAASAAAPDPSKQGPDAVARGSYHLAAKIDTDVAPVATELWAQVSHPADLGGTVHPLIVLLHGNHATCGHYVEGIPGRLDDDDTYTFSGTCPDGYVVAPSHLGYGYLADLLASWGFVVVSINANRGINGAPGEDGDEGLDLRRGRLVLHHLQQLAHWAAHGHAPPELGFDPKLLDFTHIGLMGHSRGGEGMLAAIAQYNDSGSIWPNAIGTKIHIDGVFEIAPVDGQTSRTFYANDIPWSVLLGSCDGDVYDLEGDKVYDRTLVSLAETIPTPKSVFTVWGASHNFFNSQWQQPEAAAGCLGPGNVPLFSDMKAGSSHQRMTALYPILGFMRAHVGASPQPAMAELLDPAFALPRRLAAVSTFERSFSPDAEASQIYVADDIAPVPPGETTSGITIIRGAIPEHDYSLNAGTIGWSAPGGTLQVAFPAGSVAAGFANLDMRVSLRGVCVGLVCGADPANANDTTDFSIAMLNADGSTGRTVKLSDYAVLSGPSAGPFENPHMILQSVRIPLADLGVDPQVAPSGLRLTFDQAPQGAIELAQLRLTSPAIPGQAPHRLAAPAGPQAPRGTATAPPARILPPGRITGVHAQSQAQGSSRRETVGIELESPIRLPVRDALPVLQIGGRRFAVGGYDSGRTDRMVFVLPRAAFDALPAGAAVTLQYGPDRQEYGPLVK